jgi:aspartyl-tRNA(Asn)/glutamyl-tRNA(Gln) amidotransferase subunit A
MALAAVGTDTGGSVRIPAALCGLVGYKPTARLISMRGAVPLSTSLDTVGAIGRSLACCETLVSVLSGQAPLAATLRGLAGLRLGVVRNYVTEGVEPAVAAAFERALARLSAGGAVLADLRIPALEEIPAANRLGGLPAAEAFAWHRPLLDRPEAYDPRVLVRIERGRGMTAADYIDVQHARERISRDVEAATAACDALVCPTVPILAPPLSAFDDDAEFARLNLLLLRNPTVVNFVDGAAVSLPCHMPGEGPVGLMLWGRGGTDARLLAVARSVEAALAA